MSEAPNMKSLSTPEDSSNGSMRMYAIMAYFTIIVVIGVPLWWKTTEVYRVSLPYSQIETLSRQSKNIRLKFLILSSNYQAFEIELQNHLSVFGDYNIECERYNASSQEINLINSARSEHDAASVIVDVNVNELLLIEYSKLNADVWFGNGRTILLKDASAKTMASMSAALESFSIVQRSGTEGNGGKVLTLPSIHILMTVVVPRPEEIKVEWNSKLIMEQYVKPFTNELSKIYNFTLKSQWLYLMELDFNAKQVIDDTEWGRHYAVSESRLTHLVTPLETKLAAQVALPPKKEDLTLLPTTLNLVLYIPPCQTTPISFCSSKTGKRLESEMPAFISLKWGGILIGNAPYNTCSSYLQNIDTGHASVPIFKPKPIRIMGTFLAQLRLLLGLKEPENIPRVIIAPLKSVLPRKWELDNLKRRVTLEQLASAKLTLDSLAKLLGEISNIVINDDVGESVYKAVKTIQESMSYLKYGQLDQALECSKKAFLAAETAFMHPSLLSLLYFPDDQKYAVYIPLFLPVMIPVLMSLKTMYAYFFRLSNKQKID